MTLTVASCGPSRNSLQRGISSGLSAFVQSGYSAWMSDYPTIRLLPKAEARAIRHGFPWVYANELVMDRRTRGLTPGSFAILEDAERQPMGLVTVNPASRIAARMLDRDPEAVIDGAWLRAKLSRALSYRDALYDAPFYRLIHAEADGLPGCIIDRFGVRASSKLWKGAELLKT